MTNRKQIDVEVLYFYQLNGALSQTLVVMFLVNTWVTCTKRVYVVYFIVNWRIDNPFVGHSEMTLCLTKGGIKRYFITYNVIWANQETESVVYRWFCTLALFYVMRVPRFVGASGIILSGDIDRRTFKYTTFTYTRISVAFLIKGNFIVSRVYLV